MAKLLAMLDPARTGRSSTSFAMAFSAALLQGPPPTRAPAAGGAIVRRVCGNLSELVAILVDHAVRRKLAGLRTRAQLRNGLQQQQPALATLPQLEVVLSLGTGPDNVACVALLLGCASAWPNTLTPYFSSYPGPEARDLGIRALLTSISDDLCPEEGITAQELQQLMTLLPRLVVERASHFAKAVLGRGDHAKLSSQICALNRQDRVKVAALLLVGALSHMPNAGQAPMAHDDTLPRPLSASQSVGVAALARLLAPSVFIRDVDGQIVCSLDGSEAAKTIHAVGRELLGQLSGGAQSRECAAICELHQGAHTPIGLCVLGRACVLEQQRRGTYLPAADAGLGGGGEGGADVAEAACELAGAIGSSGSRLRRVLTADRIQSMGLGGVAQPVLDSFARTLAKALPRAAGGGAAYDASRVALIALLAAHGYGDAARALAAQALGGGALEYLFPSQTAAAQEAQHAPQAALAPAVLAGAGGGGVGAIGPPPQPLLAVPAVAAGGAAGAGFAGAHAIRAPPKRPHAVSNGDAASTAVAAAVAAAADAAQEDEPQAAGKKPRRAVDGPGASSSRGSNSTAEGGTGSGASGSSASAPPAAAKLKGAGGGRRGGRGPGRPFYERELLEEIQREHELGTRSQDVADPDVALGLLIGGGCPVTFEAKEFATGADASASGIGALLEAELQAGWRVEISNKVSNKPLDLRSGAEGPMLLVFKNHPRAHVYVATAAAKDMVGAPVSLRAAGITKEKAAKDACFCLLRLLLPHSRAYAKWWAYEEEYLSELRLAGDATLTVGEFCAQLVGA